MNHKKSRRHFLANAATLMAGARLAGEARGAGDQAASRKAQIAITLDLEMSRNFPTWEDTHWDYEKGNLDAATKAYAAEAARRVAERGGTIHFFAVGRVLEQENVGWLKKIAEAGHPIGNHTYDHVNVKARRPEDLQFRFQRAPWLIAGQTIEQVIARNIAMTDEALAARIGVDSAGFRTPGGFQNGLDDRPDVQRLLLAHGFRWVSSKYPAHPNTAPGQQPGPEVLAGIVDAQAAAQPFVYPTGLVEVPMSPISDIGAFRTGRWPLDSFLEAIRQSVAWVIERRATFVFLGHPSCLVVTDPEFRAIDLIGELVDQSEGRAELVELAALADRASRHRAK